VPRRPPRKWFYRVVRRLRGKVDDPYAVAGWLWHYGMYPSTKRRILSQEGNPNPHPEGWTVSETIYKGGRMTPDPDPRRRRRYGRVRVIRRYVRPVRSRIRRGGRGLWSWKSVLAGAIGLLAMKKVIGENSMVGVSLGSYDPAVQKIATGFILSQVGLDSSDLISAGVKEGVATIADNLIAGKGIGGFGKTTTGNYL